ncbi:helix-turn-helix domain-containing protein [Carnobacterium gallinarum]|uniref:helix-turn-helix domain-containing protein n=1 Tax=Carnobacterium gallinarum TaxID=2749 RepID=UPI000555D148|nr:helix-turn-helix transcriptional regulator [Carnobacterium gallinarum]
MNSLGDKIRLKRLEKSLSQEELAFGICTQGSISNLENNARMPSLSILLQVGQRLNMDLTELMNYIIDIETPSNRLFTQLQILRSQFKNEEAYDFVRNQIIVSNLKTDYELKRYYYYYAITDLTWTKNFSDIHYNFHLALDIKLEKTLDFLDILITNGIGLAYYMESEKVKALTYFERSLEQLDDFFLTTHSSSNMDTIEICKIYYTTAKFYSDIKEYQKALDLCLSGINLQQERHLNYDLDRLYYEKAFNLFKIGNHAEAKINYSYAHTLAAINQNDILLTVIEQDRTDFQLKN